MKPSGKILTAILFYILLLNCVSQVFGEDIPAIDAESSETVVSDTSLDTASSETATDTIISGEESPAADSSTAPSTTLDEPPADPYYLFSASGNAAKSPIDLKSSSDVDLFTGTFSYYYPFNVPAGTNGLTPSVALSYSSQGASGTAGFVGLGWDLGLNYIERDVNYTPDNLGDDRFYLNLNGRNELIYVSNESRYHTKIESYLYVEKKNGSTQNTKGYYWTVKDKEGAVYQFGYYNTSSLGSEVVCSGRNYVRRWYLDKITDIHGNNITFKYVQNVDSNDIGTIYPFQIIYNNDARRVINFSLENRPDVSTKYEQGCVVKESKRFKGIQAYLDANPIRAYILNYTLDPASRSMLSTITECNGTNCLPNTTFEYSMQNGGFSSSITWSGANSYITLIDTSTYNFVLKDTFDINGDGLPDYVDGSSNLVYLDNGSGFSSTPVSWNFPFSYIRYTLSGSVSKSIFDIDGDGLPDYVDSNSIPWSVYLDNGSGFSSTPVTWPAPSSYSGYTYQDAVSKSTFDINNDGLPDYIDAGSNLVYLNNGSGFNSTPISWNFPSNYIEYVNTVSVSENTFDINGDGLPDYIYSRFAPWSVYLNNGSGFNSAISWSAPASYFTYTDNSYIVRDTFDINVDGLADYVIVNASGGFVYLNNGSGFNSAPVSWNFPFSYTKQATSYRVPKATFDINGDSLPDYVSASGTPWSVYLNNLTSPGLMVNVKNSLGGIESVNYTSSTQFDNRGSDNISDLGFSMWVVSSITSNNGMSGVQNSSITTYYNHSGGFYDHVDKEFRGFNYSRVTDSNNNSVDYYFYQDAARKGKLFNTTSFSNAGIKYSQTNNDLGFTNSSGYYTVYLQGTVNRVFDGTSLPKNTSVSYIYDSFGNVLNESYSGDLSATGDEKYVVNTYVINVSAWIIGKVSSTVLRNSSSDVSKVFYYYDNHTNLSDNLTRGDLTQKVDWINSGGANASTLFSLYPLGLVQNVTDAEGRVTKYDYESTYTYPVNVTNAKNQTTRSVYDLGTGNLLQSNDSNNITITYEYDAFGRILKEIKPYDNSSSPTTNYTYYLDGVAPEGVKVSKKTFGSENPIDVYTYVDGLGRVVQTRRNAETSNMIVEDIYYDSKGRVDKNYVPYLGTNTGNYSAPSGTKYTQFTYDPVDRVIQVVNPDGTVRNASYQRWNTTYIDENLHKKSFYNDGYNRITQVDEVNGNDVYRTYYLYNALDNLVKITDNLGNNFSFGYDSLGRKIYMVDPDMGTWNYSYDKVGNLLSQRDNLNQTTNFTYDVLNRVTKADYSIDQDITYVYDGDGGFTTGVIGTLSAVNDSKGTVRYYYDNRYRKISENRSANGVSGTTNYTYDSADRIRAERTPWGQVINFSYNSQGELNNITGIVTNIDYNAQNKVTSKTYANNVSTNFTYDSNTFRLNSIITKNSSTGLQNLSYTYDGIGNVQSITDSIEGKTQNFGYDDLDRLTSATETSSYAQSFTYNSIGNILTLTDNGTKSIYNYGQTAGPHALTEKIAANLTVTNIQPVSGFWTNLTNLTLNFTVTGSNLTYNVSLNLNGSINNQSARVVNNTVSSFNLTNLALGTYIWNVTARINSTVNDTSQTWNFTIYRTEITWCYQETANQSTSCGGLSNGSYKFPPTCYHTNGSTDAYCPELIDGNWTTSTFSSSRNYFYVNYTVPQYADPFSIWQIKDEYTARDLSIPADCWSTSRLLFRVESGPTYSPSFECYNYSNSAWIQIYKNSSGTSSWVYEEAMNWKIVTNTTTPPSQPVLNVSLNQPASGFLNNRSNLTLNFTVIGSNATYNVSLNLNGSVINQSARVMNNTLSTFNLSSLKAGTYWWNVSASINSSVFNISQTWNFTVNISPWCYQEFANVSTTCGDLSTGSYRLPAQCYHTDGSTNAYCNELIDGNWSSSTFSKPQGYYYVNYSVPQYANSSSLWEIKDEYTRINLSIPAGCWNTTRIRLRVESGPTYSPSFQCYDYSGSAWAQIYKNSSGTASWVYEEAMWWNVGSAPGGGMKMMGTDKDTEVKYVPEYENVTYISNSTDIDNTTTSTTTQPTTTTSQPANDTTTTTIASTTSTTYADTTTTLADTTSSSSTTTSTPQENTSTTSTTASQTTTSTSPVTRDTIPVNESLIVHEPINDSVSSNGTGNESSPILPASSNPNTPLEVLLAGIVLLASWGALFHATKRITFKLRAPRWAMRLMSLFACVIIITSFSASVYASTYSYDANGNMVQDSEKSQCYLYNQANQLKEVNNCSGGKIAEYWYDYTGRRLVSVEYNSSGGNVTTYYLFPDYEVVMNGSQMLNTTYYFANWERVARRDPNGSIHYYSGDHLGSTSLVTDAAGNIEEKTRYLPFGETLTHLGANIAKHLYTGQEKDTETGLYYYISRYYNPDLGRFIQPDTYTSNIYNPQDLNPYSYVQNNPIKYTDPTGHQAAGAVATTVGAYAVGVISAPVVGLTLTTVAFISLSYAVHDDLFNQHKDYDIFKAIQKYNDAVKLQEQNINQDSNKDQNPNTDSNPNQDDNTNQNPNTNENPTENPQKDMPTINKDELPENAKKTIENIDKGGPHPYEKDGTEWRNDKSQLPVKEKGYYKEYTVEPPPEATDRGEGRIVTGKNGEIYYTADHYKTFAQVLLN